MAGIWWTLENFMTIAWNWRKQFALILRAALCLAGFTASLHAQVDPRGPVRTLTTRHFDVHFPATLDSLARQAAVIAERAYQQLALELSPPGGRVQMLLIDHVDDSNGYAQVFPQSRITIFAVPPIEVSELRFADDWLKLVITHELAHVFHLDRAGGLWRLGRWALGRNPLLFPNTLTPSWVKEGLAVHYESLLTGSGRLASTEYANLLNTTVRENRLPYPSHWSRAASQYPRGQGVYAWGSELMRFANDHALRDSAVSQKSAMADFVDETATFPIPFLLSRASRTAFGLSFNSLYEALRDSVLQLQPRNDLDGALVDARNIQRARNVGSLSNWHIVSNDGWYAGPPRWVGSDTLVWTASTGKIVTSLLRASISDKAKPIKVARRNSLDVNAALGQWLVFAQQEYTDRWVVRSDIYAQNVSGGPEMPLTKGARLISPDVRFDGAIVAVQLGPNTSRLVRVQVSGNSDPVRLEESAKLGVDFWESGQAVVRSLSALPKGLSERWADPRWSPDGSRIAAIQLLPTGEQRVTMLDSTGALLAVIAGGRGVFASPSFTPDGKWLVWSSDRSGRMQLEVSHIGDGVADTVEWRNESSTIRKLSTNPWATYSPSVSPDGRYVSALLLQADGYRVAVTPFDSTGELISTSASWYSSARDGTSIAQESLSVDSTLIVNAISMPYRPFRQLLPRYWIPLSGMGRDGRPTFGAGSSASDILGRHAWSASLLLEPQHHELDAAIDYNYLGLGTPALDVGFVQQWDGSFRAVDSAGALVGRIARRRRFLSASATWAVPHFRWSMSSSVGAQLELRDFTADNDAALGESGSLLRSGTHYPQIFVSNSFSNARRALSSVSMEEGFTLSQSTSYRWRMGDGATGSWRSTFSGRVFLPLALPGFSRHVVALRGAAGIADSRSTSEFSAGGVSGSAAELLPGVAVGDPSRLFQVRGFVPGAQRGIRALGAGMEYRAPLSLLTKAPAAFTFVLDRMSLAVFGDAGRAWCPNNMPVTAAGVCNARGTYTGWLASTGGELVVDLAAGYDMPLRLRLGAALPSVSKDKGARRAAMYFTLGGYF